MRWKYLVLVLAIAFGPFVPQNADAQRSRRQVDTKARYLIYLHGRWLEHSSVDTVNRHFGRRYDYGAILGAFRAAGYRVISEIRSPVRAPRYARQVAGRVRGLIGAGVPPGNITVAGFSKGGVIALVSATMIRHARVNYVVMAGCGKPGSRPGANLDRFGARRGANMRGRVLSIYDRSDRRFGSCRRLISGQPGLRFRELVLNTREGHGLFYRAAPVWVGPATRWGRR